MFWNSESGDAAAVMSVFLEKGASESITLWLTPEEGERFFDVALYSEVTPDTASVQARLVGGSWVELNTGNTLAVGTVIAPTAVEFKVSPIMVGYYLVKVDLTAIYEE